MPTQNPRSPAREDVPPRPSFAAHWADPDVRRAVWRDVVFAALLFAYVLFLVLLMLR